MKTLIFFLLTITSFTQTMRFTGNEISIGYGRSFSGIFIEGTAGDTLSFGDICFLDADIGKFYLSNTDEDSTTSNYQVMVVDSSVLMDRVGRFIYLGIIKDTSWAYTAKDTLFLSSTSGETVTSGTKLIGIIQDSTTIYFNPNK